MKNRFLKSIRFKVVIICIESFLLSAATLYIIYQILYINRYKGFVRNVYDILMEYTTIQGLIIFTLVFLFIIYLLILVSRIIRYIDKISIGVNEIAKGNFDNKIDKISNDELGQLSKNINNMSDQIQNLIKQQQQITESKNYLITGLSHDLKTPLTSIYGYLELINNDKYKDEVELRYYTDIAFRKTIQLKNMIEQLFTYTKYNSSSMKINKVTINVKEMLNQLVVEYYPYFLKQNLECRLKFNEEKYEINADSDLLFRVFENLISNAVRYSGENSKYIDIKIESKGGKIYIHFINYDNMIPAYEQQFIFNRFYKIEQARDYDFNSSGLGLNIAKTIVELNNGKIGVVSKDNKTIFTVAFNKLIDK
ncbi:two-component sensor histidine kinase [Vallitalea longa]|uniref:histidine kinase n=1 Tax=Vallitalea longa TaxID=2936439 RepID=A0A9W5Y9B5_9FIRM|nr:HAMP domain-containing sensor histidine kinase [Vallitalea longa]GKX28934.1 two-component sensor histidine kinase [Vallitalea longa]